MKDKNVFILDIIRALCVLWIVVVWHGNDYLPMEYHWESTLIPGGVTKVVLVVFTLLSGVLLSKYRFGGVSDIWTFYKRRFGRFYLLFIIAIVLFYFCGFYSLNAAFKCMTGLSVILGQAPFTLWYMSMLMLFYLITPLLQFRYSKPFYRGLIPMLILAIMIVLKICNVMHDYYPIYYFLSYEIGLLIGEKVMALLRNHDMEDAPCAIRFVLEKIAYASFCVYLFHRVIYFFVGRCLGTANVGDIIFCMPIWGNVVAILMTFVLSYGIQRSYDRLLRIEQKY